MCVRERPQAPPSREQNLTISLYTVESGECGSNAPSAPLGTRGLSLRTIAARRLLRGGHRTTEPGGNKAVTGRTTPP